MENITKESVLKLIDSIPPSFEKNAEILKERKFMINELKRAVKENPELAKILQEIRMDLKK